MAHGLTTESLIETLRKRGDARGSTRWPQFDPDYVSEYSLTADHVQALISLATQWVDEPPDNSAVYGPVHAWRALAQLRAVEAVQPLLDVQDKLDALGDDWYLEEFHHVFGLIGPPAIESLANYLADDTRAEFPRAKAAAGLREIVRHFPETRSRVVAILTAELARHQSDVGCLIGLMVGDLLRLKAVESAETIERAFAANVVDPAVAGDWEEVRQELGVPGLGIAPGRSPGRRSFPERLGLPDPASERRRVARERKKKQHARRHVKAKRKQNNKVRKRNGKPR